MIAAARRSSRTEFADARAKVIYNLLEWFATGTRPQATLARLTPCSRRQHTPPGQLQERAGSSPGYLPR